MSIRGQSQWAYCRRERDIDHNGKMFYSVGYLRKEEKPTIGFEPTTY